jgi:hypothetical protein
LRITNRAIAIEGEIRKRFAAIPEPAVASDLAATSYGDEQRGLPDLRRFPLRAIAVDLAKGQ